jgi:predicted nucleic-acid-binding Zn-ribbon protein
MALTLEQSQKVIDALNGKSRGKCPICGQTNLIVMSEMVMLPMHSKLPADAAESPESTMPCVLSACKNCGNVQMFNVHILGIASDLDIPAPDALKGRAVQHG